MISSEDPPLSGTDNPWQPHGINNAKPDELVELSHRMQMALEIGRMEWWEIDLKNEVIRSEAGTVFFDLAMDGNGIAATGNYADKIHPDDLPSVISAFNNYVAGKTEYFDTEYRIFGHQGTLRWLHSRGVIFSRHSDGSPLKLIGLVQDISHYKQVQAELLEAKRKAEEADRLKTAFLTNMSHEIRTPMNAIIGFSELLDDPNIKKEDITNYTAIIKSRSAHLLQIVNDILDISRIEANQVELKESPVILNQLLDELYLYYAQRLIDEKKLRILLNIIKPKEEDGRVFRVDELRFRQILGNLLDNAVKFTQEGSIEFGYRLVENTYLFHVSDTGIGVPEEKQDIIFERFQQVDTSLARQYGGNGLGLAICKAFVELMGGRIWMESLPQKGSTFYFTLPVNKLETAKPAERMESSILSGFHWQGKRVLLVEDDLHSSVFMTELFALTGLEIVCVTTAMEALKVFGPGSGFDLVLMDIQLPDRSGIELTRLLKGIDPKVPVIAQTAYAMAGDNIKCLQAGCDDYISKPLNISDLFSKINNLINR